MLRYLVIGALAAIGTTTFVVVFGAGIYWLWIFGDDPWPVWAGNVLVAAGGAVGLAVFIGFAATGYRRNRPVGKPAEGDLPR